MAINDEDNITWRLCQMGRPLRTFRI